MTKTPKGKKGTTKKPAPATETDDDSWISEGDATGGVIIMGGIEGFRPKHLPPAFPDPAPAGPAPDAPKGKGSKKRSKKGGGK